MEYTPIMWYLIKAAGVASVVMLIGVAALIVRIRYLDWKGWNRCNKQIDIPCEFGSTYQKTLPCAREKGHSGPHKIAQDKRTVDSIWGPLGHFTVWQKEEDDDWSIEGVLTGETDTRTYSHIQTTRELAVEHAKVLAGIAPFGPDGILQTHPVPNRRAAIAHTRALS